MWLVKDERIRLPITPYFEIESGINNTKEDLNEIGTVNLAGKPGLRTCSISSFFPSKEGPYIESRDTKLDPYYYYDKIYQWSREGDPIRFIITETPYNFECLIDSFTAGETDGSGDLYYTLELSEYIRLKTTKYEKPSYFDQMTWKDGRPIPPKSVFTVRDTDTRWTIAKRLFGSGELGDEMIERLGGKDLKPGTYIDTYMLEKIGSFSHEVKKDKDGNYQIVYTEPKKKDDKKTDTKDDKKGDKK